VRVYFSDKTFKSFGVGENTTVKELEESVSKKSNSPSASLYAVSPLRRVRMRKTDKVLSLMSNWDSNTIIEMASPNARGLDTSATEIFPQTPPNEERKKKRKGRSVRVRGKTDTSKSSVPSSTIPKSSSSGILQRRVTKECSSCGYLPRYCSCHTNSKPGGISKSAPFSSVTGVKQKEKKCRKCGYLLLYCACVHDDSPSQRLPYVRSLQNFKVYLDHPIPTLNKLHNSYLLVYRRNIESNCRCHVFVDNGKENAGELQQGGRLLISLSPQERHDICFHVSSQSEVKKEIVRLGKIEEGSFQFYEIAITEKEEKGVVIKTWDLGAMSLLALSMRLNLPTISFSQPSPPSSLAPKKMERIQKPDDLSEILQKLRAYIDQDKLSAAMRFATAILEQNITPSCEILYLYATLPGERLCERIEKVMEYQTPKKWAKLFLALKETAKENYDVAKTILLSLLDHSPNFPLACFQLANLHFTTSKWNDAANYYKKALGCNFEWGHEAHLKLSFLSDDKEEKLDHLKAAVAVCPSFVHGWVDLGKLYISVGAQQEGLESLNKAVEVNPKSVLARSKRAEMYEKYEEMELAVEDWRVCVQYDHTPSSLFSYFHFHSRLKVLVFPFSISLLLLC